MPRPHVGGFVITRGPLVELAVVTNAAMEDRTVLEWDKDDIDALGILKVDVLGLGMLSCLRRAFDLLRRHHRLEHDLANLPRDARPPTPCCAGPTASASSRSRAGRR